MTFYERLEELRNKSGISQGKLEKELGFSNGSISKWKNSMPTHERLQKVADYFGVPLEYLTTGKMPEDTPSYYPDDVKEMADFMFQNPEYKVLFDATRKVKPEDINFIREMIERMERE